MELASVLSSFSSVFAVVLTLLGNLASWVVQTPVVFVSVCILFIGYVIRLFWWLFTGG